MPGKYKIGVIEHRKLWLPAGITFLFILVSLTLLSCSNSVAPATETIQPTYSSLKQNIFGPGCTTSSCHSFESMRGGLVLVGDTAYSFLVNQDCDNDVAFSKGLKRVKPGYPDSSFLYIKLTGPATGEGDRMPYNNSSLSPDQINAVRTWIANGAKRD